MEDRLLAIFETLMFYNSQVGLVLPTLSPPKKHSFPLQATSDQSSPLDLVTLYQELILEYMPHTRGAYTPTVE